MSGSHGLKSLVERIFLHILGIVLTAGTIYYYTHDAQPRNHEYNLKDLDHKLAMERTKQIEIQAKAGILTPETPVQKNTQNSPPSAPPSSDVLVLDKGRVFGPGKYRVKFAFQAKNLYGLGFLVSTNDRACNSARPALECLEVVNSASGSEVTVYVDENIPHSSVYIGEK